MFSTTFRTHRSRRRRLLAPLAAAGALALAVTGTAPAFASPTSARAGAAAATPTYVSLESTGNDVTSSTGRALTVDLFSSTHYLEVLLVGRGAATGETHALEFSLPGGYFSVSAQTGSGYLRTHSAEGTYGEVRVTVSSAAAATKRVCSAANYTTTRRVTLRGDLLLRTHSSGSRSWGAVGSAVRAFRFGGTTTLVSTYGTGCFPRLVPPCQASISWFANGGTTGLFGVNRVLGVYREVTLASPAHSYRFDEVDATVPAPTITGTGSQAVLHATGNGGNLVGAIALHATAAPKAISASCRQNGKTVTQHGSDWPSARVSFGRTHLHANEEIFGAIYLGSKSTSSFSRLAK